MKKSLIIIFLAFAAIMFAACLGETAPTQNFHDEKLGLSFEYPATWGEAEWSDGDIIFPNRSEIQLVMINFPSDESAMELCNSNLTLVGRDDMKNENGEDVYVKNGYYSIGDCEGDSPHLDSVILEPGLSNEWLPLDEETEDSTEIFLTRSYYFDLETLYYPRMIISVRLPNINSQEACLMRVASMCEEENSEELTSTGEDEAVAEAPGEPSLECPLFQNLKCTNYAEKEMIEDAFEDLDDSDFGEEIDALLESMVIEPVENAEELFTASYNANYEELTEYSNDVLGVSFTYPAAFGEMEFNEASESISAGGNFSIDASTLEDVIGVEEAYYAEMEGGGYPSSCFNSLPTEKKWQSDYDNFYESAEENEDLIQLGENQFLLSSDGRCGDSVTEGKYITFVEDIRFEIRGNTVKNVEQFTWMAPYQLIDYQLRTAILEEILASMVFL